METKTCSKCKECKPLDAFGKNRTTRDGLKWRCKACCAKCSREWGLRNREKVNAATAKWRATNQEKVKAYSADYRKENKDRRNKANAEWRATNQEKVKAYSADYRKENKDRRNKASAEWRKNNPEKQKAATKTWAENNREKQVEKHRNARKKVTRCYAATALGMPVADLTDEMYAAYREQLFNKRALRELTSTLKEMTDEQ